MLVRDPLFQQNDFWLRWCLFPRLVYFLARGRLFFFLLLSELEELPLAPLLLLLHLLEQPALGRPHPPEPLVLLNDVPAGAGALVAPLRDHDPRPAVLKQKGLAGLVYFLEFVTRELRVQKQIPRQLHCQGLVCFCGRSFFYVWLLGAVLQSRVARQLRKRLFNSTFDLLGLRRLTKRRVPSRFSAFGLLGEGGSLGVDSGGFQMPFDVHVDTVERAVEVGGAGDPVLSLLLLFESELLVAVGVRNGDLVWLLPGAGVRKVAGRGLVALFAKRVLIVTAA